MKYKDYNDYELLSYIKEQNEEANEIIYEKYRPLILKIAKKLISSSSNIGVDIADLIGEGMLGLANAIDNYDDSNEILFYTYASKCIENAMLTFLSKGKSLKNKCLSESISICWSIALGRQLPSPFVSVLINSFRFGLLF